MIIALDVDGVLVDCNNSIREYAQKLLKRQLPSVEDWKDFAFPAAMKMTFEEGLLFHESIVTDDALPYSFSWYSGATDFVHELLDAGHDVFFLTSHWSGYPEWVTARERMLHLEFPHLDVVFTHSKQRAHFDLLLDDKPSTIATVGSERGRLLDRPWNRPAQSMFNPYVIVNDYAEFLKRV